MKRGNYVLVLLPVVFEACFSGMFNGRLHLHTSRGGLCMCVLTAGWTRAREFFRNL